MMRESLDRQRAGIAEIRRDVGWLVDGVSSLMARQGLSHDLPNGAHVDAAAIYERRTRRRINEASTSGAHVNDVPTDQHAV